MSRLVIVTGPPGAGKTTIARRLSQSAAGPLAMHMHTDDIYGYIQKGFLAPWLPESREQNVTLMNAMAAQAAICLGGGYEVYVDGIVGPWFFEPWLEVARRDGIDLRYVVLLPDEETAVARGTARKNPGAMTDAAVIRRMWQAFQDFPPAPAHIVDTTGHRPPETVALVRDGLAAGGFKLS